jgi:hypothetical protein
MSITKQIFTRDPLISEQYKHFKKLTKTIFCLFSKIKENCVNVNLEIAVMMLDDLSFMHSFVTEYTVRKKFCNIFHDI